MNRLQPKILIIGIDGATFDLIEPWADQGKLPTFKSLLDAGVHGELKSTIPPVTAPAWTSFMTGMNPGKHGLFDFLEPIRIATECDTPMAAHGKPRPFGAFSARQGYEWGP